MKKTWKKYRKHEKTEENMKKMKKTWKKYSNDNHTFATSVVFPENKYFKIFLASNISE